MRLLLSLLLLPIRLLLWLIFKRRDMVFLPDDDPEMKKAREKAKETFSYFRRVLSLPEIGMENFAVKVEYILDDGSEHIWVSELEIREDVIHGKISNDPNKLEDLVLGSDVIVDEDNISDWAYSNNGYYHGHFTTKVLLPHMKKSMRNQVITIYGWEKDFA